mmetsp:Transcript_7488/g.19662  ORF Transcript_7488/g.19662 Transcript_7488/m.19662 type:complete len:92 (+) Transcript_7488:3372-3647(+)
MRVAVRREDLEDAVVYGQKRDVERAAPEVKHQDVLLALLLVHAVGDGRGRRLVDDALHRHAADRARVLRRLALRVVEVGRHRDDGVLHFAT